MTNKFLRYDGTNWNLDQGLVGPQGLPGLPGVPGPAGDSALIYRPGGVAAGSVFTSWTTLMAQRTATTNPVTIVIDDSIISPAVVDVGVWDLTHNTKIVGYKGNQNTQFQGVSNTLTQLSIPEGAQLFNPNYFQDLDITGFAQTIFSIDSGPQPGPHNGSMNFTAYNVIFQTDGSANKPLIHTNGGVMDFYGCCHLISSNNAAFIITNTATQPVFINLHDSSVIDGYTLFFSGGTVSLTVSISDSAFYSTSQPGISIPVTVRQLNIVQAQSRDSLLNPNIIAIRSFQSPTDNTQEGIVNLSSDTSGASTGVTAGYSTISGGDQNSIADIDGVIGGGRANSIAAGSPFAVISGGVGNSIATNSQGAVIGGGFGNSVSGFAAAVLAGDSNHATAYGAVVIGGEVTTASRAFQEAFGIGGNGAQRGIYYVGKQAVNAVPGFCGDNLGGQFTLDNDHSYIIDVTALATKLSAPRGIYAAFKAKVLAHCTSGGIAVIDQYIPDPANASLLNGTAFAFGITVSGTNNIIIAHFTGLNAVTNCQYRFDWVELA
jgi:hypothetical protein